MSLTEGQPTFVGQWSYDAESHWLVFTETGGASAIVAYDVPSTWAARMLPLLNEAQQAIASADRDASLVHDFLYGRGGRAMDEAHAAIWRIHDALRPLLPERLS